MILPLGEQSDADWVESVANSLLLLFKEQFSPLFCNLTFFCSLRVDVFGKSLYKYNEDCLRVEFCISLGYHFHQITQYVEVYFYVATDAFGILPRLHFC